jgi:hypothetical protein
MFAENKTLAAREKTSTGLLHVTEIPGLSFLPEKRRLRQVRTPHQAAIHKWICYFCDRAYSYLI